MHFEALGVPKHSPDFDSAHFCRVMSFVEDYNKAESDDDTFLYLPFSRDEVSQAILDFNNGKASGFDGVTTEHIRYAGDSMVSSLTNLCNMVRVPEYVPVCCRIGVCGSRDSSVSYMNWESEVKLGVSCTLFFL